MLNIAEAVIIQAVRDLKSRDKGRAGIRAKIEALSFFQKNNRVFLKMCEYSGLDSDFFLKKIDGEKIKARLFLSGREKGA